MDSVTSVGVPKQMVRPNWTPGLEVCSSDDLRGWFGASRARPNWTPGLGECSSDDLRGWVGALRAPVRALEEDFSRSLGPVLAAVRRSKSTFAPTDRALTRTGLAHSMSQVSYGSWALGSASAGRATAHSTRAWTSITQAVGAEMADLGSGWGIRPWLANF